MRRWWWGRRRSQWCPHIGPPRRSQVPGHAGLDTATQRQHVGRQRHSAPHPHSNDPHPRGVEQCGSLLLPLRKLTVSPSMTRTTVAAGYAPADEYGGAQPGAEPRSRNTAMMRSGKAVGGAPSWGVRKNTQYGQPAVRLLVAAAACSGESLRTRRLGVVSMRSLAALTAGASC